MTIYVRELHPIFDVPSECTVEVASGARTLTAGSADIFRFTVTPWTPDMSIDFNSQAGLDPDIEQLTESAFRQQWPYNERLKFVASLVKGAVAAFEYDCVGESREPDWLIQQFKDKSDERRPKWLPATPA
jgi:hypothetical protein